MPLCEAGEDCPAPFEPLLLPPPQITVTGSRDASQLNFDPAGLGISDLSLFLAQPEYYSRPVELPNYSPPASGPYYQSPFRNFPPPPPPIPAEPPIIEAPEALPFLIGVGRLLSGIVGVLVPTTLGEGQVPLYVPPPPLPEFPPLNIPEIPLSPEPVEPIPEVTVTAPMPYEFIPSQDPDALRSPGGNVPLPDFERTLTPAISPSRIIGPASPRPTPILSPVVIPAPTPIPRTSPTARPSPSPRPSPLPQPSPGAQPSPLPFPQPIIARPPRPIAPINPISPIDVSPSNPTVPGRLTAPEPSALGSVPVARTTTTTTDAGLGPPEPQCKCTVPGTKPDNDRKKKYGCRQGYFRETAEGITYIEWSTRRCPSSKGNSQSPQRGRPITS